MHCGADLSFRNEMTAAGGNNENNIISVITKER